MIVEMHKEEKVKQLIRKGKRRECERGKESDGWTENERQREARACDSQRRR